MVCEAEPKETFVSKEGTQRAPTEVETMEVYLRLKGDNEKDYLLTIPKYTPLKDIPIFKQELLDLEHSKLISEFKLVLKPTLFHKSTLSVINKSVHPGILIKEGASLIYDYDCDENPYLKELDLNKSAETQLWPHQLILPKWEVNYFNIFIYIALMTVWLISDIPQYINPWKNKNLTYLLNLFFFKVFTYFKVESFSRLIAKDMIEVNNLNNDSSLILLWGIYGMHILKVLLLTFFLRVGLINPPSLNPLFYYFKYFKEGDHQKKEQKRLSDYMVTIGLNGLKRCNLDQYKTHIYNFFLQKAGNDQVAAYKLGYFPKMKGDGVVLGKGEGFDSDLSKRFDVDTFEIMEKEGKFVLSEAYYQEIYNEMVYQMNNQDEAAFITTLRNFKRFGMMDCHSERLNNLFIKREELELAKDKKKK